MKILYNFLFIYFQFFILHSDNDESIPVEISDWEWLQAYAAGGKALSRGLHKLQLIFQHLFLRCNELLPLPWFSAANTVPLLQCLRINKFSLVRAINVPCKVSLPAQSLGSWVRIQLETCIPMCVYSSYIGLCRLRPGNGLIPRPRSPTDCVQDKKLKKQPRSNKGLLEPLH
jgi:hypothetical protein